MSSAALTLDHDIWKPKYNPWLIAVVVSLAAFMEVLDTSIANVALPYVAGDLASSNDESTWVLTSYLVSNAIVLPISGWLAGTFGRKRFFMICLFLFTVSSLLCGVASSLGLLLFYRRWRSPAYGPGHSGRHVSAATKGHGVCALRNHGGGGAHYWPDAGRMDYIQLFLAMDLFH